MDITGALLYYNPKPKKGRYGRVRRKSFAWFGSWAHRTRTARKGAYRPRS
jgi:hypothetical protein